MLARHCTKVCASSAVRQKTAYFGRYLWHDHLPDFSDHQDHSEATNLKSAVKTLQKCKISLHLPLKGEIDKSLYINILQLLARLMFIGMRTN
jgi:hypothetical protein